MKEEKPMESDDEDADGDDEYGDEDDDGTVRDLQPLHVSRKRMSVNCHQVLLEKVTIMLISLLVKINIVTKTI